MNEHERLIRDLYAARSRRDFDAVRRLLADDGEWHEPGDQDYSGDYRGADEIVAMLRRLVSVTEGTFDLIPENFLHGGRVAEAWFFPDGYDAEAVAAVFAFDS